MHTLLLHVHGDARLIIWHRTDVRLPRGVLHLLFLESVLLGKVLQHLSDA